ncbi:MAG TPA: SRPBCC family protein [Herpetosiphonaceae bacterium]|nr:SRPBCC family protein [Herpetosiphonaceae bacterium]
MDANDYHFVTRWRVPGTIEEVGAILGDVNTLAVWWPSVYLGVSELEPGDERGVGKLIELHTKGWLPYTLRWRFRVTEVAPPGHIRLDAEGDFVGRGIWTLARDGAWTDIAYDWRIRAEKPLLRRLSWLLKPVLSANHHWAMAKGEESLTLELARRRAAAQGAPAAERAAIAAPPGPASLPLGQLALLGALGLAGLALRRRIARS